MFTIFRYLKKDLREIKSNCAYFALDAAGTVICYPRNISSLHLTVAADVNFTDQHGQTIMHEIAREWHTDVANFLLHHHADIDLPDHFGRTPLFVAVAADYVKMVQWLLDHGGMV